MIQVLNLQKDGIEQPQFFLLTYRDPALGEAHEQTIKSGTEAQLREVLANGGIAQADIDSLFANVNH